MSKVLCQNIHFSKTKVAWNRALIMLWCTQPYQMNSPIMLFHPLRLSSHNKKFIFTFNQSRYRRVKAQTVYIKDKPCFYKRPLKRRMPQAANECIKAGATISKSTIIDKELLFFDFWMGILATEEEPSNIFSFFEFFLWTDNIPCIGFVPMRLGGVLTRVKWMPLIYWPALKSSPCDRAPRSVLTHSKTY